jgi:crossover junction endodeoxyribonuclease RuvC
MRVLGVDPGSHATGFGVVERIGGALHHRQHGVIRPTKGRPLAERLARLQQELDRVIAEAAPDVAVVERVFLAANPRSALVLGQARGVILASLGRAGVQVTEVAARQAKQAITGSGAADKDQIQRMVARLLALDSLPPTDAADALALALTQAHAGVLTELPTRSRRRGHRQAFTRALAERAR